MNQRRQFLLLLILQLVALPFWCCLAQSSPDGTNSKPSHYRSPAAFPPEEKEIRKVAQDEHGRPQKNFGVLSTPDNEPFSQVIGDRLEFRNSGKEQVVLWDTDAWWGTDYNKLYLESEGEWNNEGRTDSANLEVYWNHAIASFWDTQVGWRHDFVPGESRDFFAVGVMGMAPYVFEVDATAYLSDDGDASAVFEVERDFLLTQRLIFQPRAESKIAFSDASDYDTLKGFTHLEYGIRLRYELRRKFAPYIGVSWEQALGQTENLLERKEDRTSQTFFVTGLKFWF